MTKLAGLEVLSKKKNIFEKRGRLDRPPFLQGVNFLVGGGGEGEVILQKKKNKKLECLITKKVYKREHLAMS